MNEVVYKALTRPAMVFGVPVTPFFIAMSIIGLIALYTEVILLSLCVPVALVLREMTKKMIQFLDCCSLNFNFLLTRA